jgi:hypothetical protein
MSDLQDGMLAHYLVEVAMSDSTVEQRLASMEWNRQCLTPEELDEAYKSTKHFRRLKRFLADYT